MVRGGINFELFRFKKNLKTSPSAWRKTGLFFVLAKLSFRCNVRVRAVEIPSEEADTVKPRKRD
jgi:hypothetical protein